MSESRVFNEFDQQQFARLTGDTNPMHMDRILARRTQAGEPVVHGMNVLLWALDSLAEHISLSNISSIKAKFEKFIALDRNVECSFVKSDEFGAEIDVRCRSIGVLSIFLKFGPIRSAAVPVYNWLSPPVGLEDIGAAYPKLSAAIGVSRVSALGQISRLVGMVNPGLNSILSMVEVDLVEQSPGDGGIGFNVERADERFSIVVLKVAGSGIAGRTIAFERKPPVVGPSMEAAAAGISPTEFAGSSALILGGSRGLGEVAAKLVAAGGGRPIITYAVGREDAERVAGEISCQFRHFDATNPASSQLSDLPSLTHVYYFASPQIFVQKGPGFDVELHRRFLRFYVDAFHEVYRALGPVPAYFYPSTIAVETRPQGMAEYVMAKTAGEILCAELASEAKMRVERLPRILTDQTAVVARVHNADALETMTPLIRAFQAS